MSFDIKIHPTEGFLRQRDNPGAVVNVDNTALQAYKQRRNLEMRKEEEINIMKNELSEIKIMLSQLLEKNNK